MGVIQSSIQLRDGFSGPLQHMSNALNMTISNMARMQSASANCIDISSIQAARSELAQAEASFNRVEEEIRQANTQQQNFNNSMRNGTSSANGLLNVVRQIGGAYLGIQGVGKLIGASDTMASNKARLNLIVDDGGSVRELEGEIFQSAQRSRAAYTDVAQTISKLGLTAGSAFSNNKEIIAFTELMNKNFVIGGADTTAKQAAMYQLTQAMQSGRLQGDEFRSIIENAPLLANSIEDYMKNVQGAKGSMKEWASEGLLTADVIKNAMFMSADEVNSRFKSMPLTWGQVWTMTCNNIIRASEPVLSAISLMAQHWDILGPIVYGVVAALLVYNATSGIAWLTTLQHAAALAWQAVCSWAATGAIVAMELAQHGLNAAILACPLSWFLITLIIIIAVFYAAVAAVNHFAGTSISATGIIAGCFMWVCALIANLFIEVGNVFIAICGAMYNATADVANFIGSVFNDPVGAAAKSFEWLGNTAIDILSGIASAMDTILGTNMKSAVEGWRKNLQSFANTKFERKTVMKKINVNDYILKEFNLKNAYNTGYNWGKKFKLGGGSKDKMPKIDTSKLGKLSNTLPNSAAKDLGKTANGAGQTAANTAKMAKVMDATGEDIKYLRDVAEREVINRFTGVSINVDMNNNNTINSTMDLDGITDYLGEALNEKLQVVAEGVYS